MSPMHGPVSSGAAVLVAALLDRTLVEPPARVHPVVWIGMLADRLARHVPAAPPATARRCGAWAWTAGLAVVGAAGWRTEMWARRRGPVSAALMRGTALWTLVSLEMLCRGVEAVEQELGTATDGDLTAARTAVAHLVSRDTGTLTGTQIREAALSSLAENLVDGWSAPLLAYALAGLPGAAAYRYVNTLDAMWGYRCARWRDAGRLAARADDVANLVPARLTGIALLCWPGARMHAWRRLATEASATPSPNGGWPMGALALRHDIRLAKPGVYVLNPAGRHATADDTHEAIRRVRRLGLVLAAGAALVRVVVIAGAGGWRPTADARWRRRMGGARCRR
jgi:adenosylcobinamide-phosphate synthase